MAQLNNSFLAVAVLATSTLLVGCNQSLNSIAPTAPPAALPSAPAEPVASGQLPPINGGQADATGRNQAARQAAANEQLASAPVTPEINNAAPVSEPTRSTSGSAKITREGMAGSWQVPTDGADCRIIWHSQSGQAVIAQPQEDVPHLKFKPSMHGCQRSYCRSG